MTPARIFSKILGTPHITVGRTSPIERTSRGMRPSTAWAMPIWMQIASRHLPKAWDSGSHSRWTSPGPRKFWCCQAAPM